MNPNKCSRCAGYDVLTCMKCNPYRLAGLAPKEHRVPIPTESCEDRKMDPTPTPNPKHHWAYACTDAIKIAASELSGGDAYLLGCAIRYLWRFGKKKEVVDLTHAKWYIDQLLNTKGKG